VQPIAGETIMSGSTNAGDAFDLIASHPAAESSYAGIIRLVKEAQHSDVSNSGPLVFLT
jgi:cation transport ATPase